MTYTGKISLQYNKIQGRYTEFIGNSIGTGFIVTKRDHEFLLSQRSNKPNMSSNSITFGPLNINDKCSNFIQVAPTYTADSSQYVYHAQK